MFEDYLDQSPVTKEGFLNCEYLALPNPLDHNKLGGFVVPECKNAFLVQILFVKKHSKPPPPAGKYFWQGLIKTPPDTPFFLIHPFQNLRLKIVSPSRKGVGTDTVHSLRY